MKHLGQSSEIIQRTVKEMSLTTRLFLTICVCAVIGGGLYVLRSSQETSQQHLFGGRSLAVQELDAVEIAFSRAGLNGWTRDNDKILIPVQNRNKYLSALDDNAALPVSLRSSVQQAIENASLFESTSQRQSRELNAKQRDLGNKLAAFPDIRWASVEYDRGERDGFSGRRTQSASVVVRPEGDLMLPLARVETIREFIRGSYADMLAENIVVVDTNADPNACYVNDPIAFMEREQQASLEQEVREILRGYDGLRVKAYVQIANANACDAIPVSQAPPPAVTVVEPVQPQPTVDHNSDPGLIGLISAVTRVKGSRTKRINSPLADQKSKIPSTQNHNLHPAIQSISLSIGIPESHLRSTTSIVLKQGDFVSPEHADQQLQQAQQRMRTNVTATVRPAVLTRLVDSAERGQDDAVVEVYSFPDTDISVTPIAGNGLLNQNEFSITSIPTQTLIIGVVGSVFAILLLGSIRGNKQPSSEPTTKSVAEQVPVDEPVAEVDDNLTALVRDNPDRAIQVIQAWLGEAA